MSAALTRRSLVTTAGATLGAIALPAGTSAPATAATPPTAAAATAAPDAELFDLLSRRGEAFAAAKAAEVDLEAAEEVTSTAWDAKPVALWRGARDTHLGFAPSSMPMERGSARRFYTVEDVEEMVAEAGARGQLDLTPYQAERDARRREIIAAHAAWDSEVRRAQAATGYDALSDRFDAAWDALMAIERQIARVPAGSLAGLCAKAAMLAEVADRRGLEHVPIDLAREVAAFRVTA